MPFTCLRCGRCCLNTEMPLTEDDVRRLERLGYRGFYELRDGLLRLKNVDGHCFFYDPKSRTCRVYPDRPEGCRVYPFIYVEGVGVTVDPECSAAYTATEEDVARAAPKVLRLLRKLGVLGRKRF
ncbi:MAG: YkgJ family cysteine cluster protein [Thermoprotei archaeon]|nr:MAG: YkgJ family cysteine cluster protein [Thermoprotei archaeon]